MKTMLLGGSNSVIKTGLSLGLDINLENNFSVGATSSLQNLHSLIKEKNKATASKLIISESNVNDIYNIDKVGLNKDLVIKNMEDYFYHLYLTAIPIIILILPIKRFNNEGPSDLTIKTINLKQIELCKKYGFYYLDVHKEFSRYSDNSEESKKIQLDRLHASNSYMYTLGCILKEFFINNELLSQNNSFNFDEYVYFSTIDPKSNDLKKHNSRFTRTYTKVHKLFETDLKNNTLIGIETWCDNYCKVKITDKNSVIIKQFNSLLAFNEITTPLSGRISISPINPQDFDCTEPSVNTVFKEEDKPKEGFLITSLLVKKNKQPSKELIENINHNIDCNLSYLLPKIEPFISTINLYLNNNIKIKENDAITLRDIAINLENSHPEMSLKLMEVAHKIKPYGMFIIEKIKEYKTLDSKEKTKRQQ